MASRPDSFLNLIHYDDAASLVVAALKATKKGQARGINMMPKYDIVVSSAISICRLFFYSNIASQRRYRTVLCYLFCSSLIYLGMEVMVCSFLSPLSPC